MKTFRLAIAVATFAVSGVVFAAGENPDVQPGFFTRMTVSVLTSKPVLAFAALSTAKKAGVVVVAGAAVAAAAYGIYSYVKPVDAEAEEEAAE
jgi:hypothetical protein